MGGDAVAMFAFGAIALWGGLLASVVHYIRASRRDDGA
jgi:hypothetical protein